MAGDFQRQFNEAVREAELEDVRKEVNKLAKLDPMADLKKSLTKADTDLKADLKKVDDSIAGSLQKPDAVNPAPKTPPAEVSAPVAAPVSAAEAPATPAPTPPIESAPVPAGEAKA